jgi:hypothetical protein
MESVGWSLRWTYIEQSWYTRAVDVRVEESCRYTFLGRCEREVDGDGALAHAAFGAADCDDILDVTDWTFLRKACGMLGMELETVEWW